MELILDCEIIITNVKYKTFTISGFLSAFIVSS